MIWRLTDYSIRARLYVLGILGFITITLVLLVSAYLVYQFRVEGPRHLPIKVKRQTRAEVSPPTIYLVELYLILQEMETAKSSDELRELLARFDALVAQYEEKHAKAVERLSDPTLKRQMGGDIDRTAREMIRVSRTEYLPLLGKEAMQSKISSTLRERIRPAFLAHRQAAVQMDQALVAEIDRLDERLIADSQRALFWLMVVSAILLAVGGVIGLVTVRGIIRGTRELLQQVCAMASGASDLTARIPVRTGDEMGELAEGINAMIAKIQSIVNKVRESSIQLLSTASQIAATARQQDATVQGLSSSTTEVAAAVREITATSKELSETMSEVNERANQAASLAATGSSRLGSMETTMQQLVESTASISAKLATIREKADSINVVVTTITKVADQTNLLSINAAIEAEKAGEYGRGFLVVAREIRRLADQTAVATLDIENMVRHMQDAVTTGVMQMDKFSEEVRSGVGKVAEINGQTEMIIEEVHKLSERFRQVNEGMHNQTLGAEQINEAMTNMTTNIRQTAAALEEFHRATAHLRGSVELLNQEITQFKS